VFYVAHRLFAAHDRMLAAMVAHRITRHGGASVFLPFFDTNEEDLVHDAKGRRLFELDLAQLNELSGMLAILHGPSLDDGVCMEIGYAAARGIPVVALTTDFITYGWESCGPSFRFPDPLVEEVVTDVIRLPNLAQPARNSTDAHLSYHRRNADQLARSIDVAVTRLLELATEPSAAPVAVGTADHVAFCEPSPYWHDPHWPRLVQALELDGYQTLKATRFCAADPATAARTDWVCAAHAGLLIADVSGPETPPGAALLIGACTARGCRVLARHHALTWTFANGREPNWRNLMIQYAVHDRFSGSQHPTLPGNP